MLSGFDKVLIQMLSGFDKVLIQMMSGFDKVLIQTLQTQIFETRSASETGRVCACQCQYRPRSTLSSGWNLISDIGFYIADYVLSLAKTWSAFDKLHYVYWLKL